jgi:hypothetical protein
MKNTIIKTKQNHHKVAMHDEVVPEPVVIIPALPTHEAIAQRAYEMYIMDGRQEGQCQKNWQEAESELCKQNSAQKAPAQQFMSKLAPYDGAKRSAMRFDATPSTTDNTMDMDGKGPRRGNMTPLPEKKHGSDA